MLKKSTFVFLLIIGFFTFLGCNAASNDVEGLSNEHSVVELADANTPERKIIYNVDISFDVTNLDDAAEFIHSNLDDDEWFDKEIINSYTYSYVIRIRTERLDDFITVLKDEFALRTYQKVGTDISLQYQDANNEILSLQAQLDRLLDLYDQATLSEMILINEQISDIEVRLQELNGVLAEYDSLADYSVVSIDIYGSTVTTDSPFINRLGNAIVSGFNGLMDFFDGLLIVLATILPFVIVFGGIGLASYAIYRKRKVSKNKVKNDALEDNQK